MSKALKIYISLPITGREAQARQHAEIVKADLSRKGHKPVNPFDIYAGKNPSYADFICADLRALADCDAILLCNGWQYSKGCRIEHFFAGMFGKIILFEPIDNDGIRQHKKHFRRILRDSK